MIRAEGRFDLVDYAIGFVRAGAERIKAGDPLAVCHCRGRVHFSRGAGSPVLQIGVDGRQALQRRVVHGSETPASRIWTAMASGHIEDDVTIITLRHP
ncbi:MAG: hypothetical protein ACXVX1_01800 [Mycobacterium sp.]